MAGGNIGVIKFRKRFGVYPDHVVRNYSTGLGIASLMRLWIATAANADGGAPG